MLSRWSPRPRSRPARWSTAGTASPCCTPRPPRVGGLDLGFVPGDGGLAAAAMAAGRRSTSCSCSAPTRSTSSPGAFVVYLGTHGDRGAHRADVILPGAAYTEKAGDLRQHRGPRADGRPRRLPAGRCARGLGDPARAVRRARPAAALRLAAAAARHAVRAPSASRHRSTPSRPAAPTTCERSRRSAAASTRRRSSRRSRTSISPIRSRARPR